MRLHETELCFSEFVFILLYFFMLVFDDIVRTLLHSYLLCYIVAFVCQ